MVQFVSEGVVKQPHWPGGLAEEHSVVLLIRRVALARLGCSLPTEAALAPWVGAVAP